MRFTQQIIATFALLSICAYANPMPVGNELDISGLLIAREPAETTWCGGLSDGQCATHCQTTLGRYARYTCYAKYVNLEISTEIPQLTNIKFYSSCFCVS